LYRDSEEIVHVSAPPLVMDVTATGPQNQSQPRMFEAAAKKARLKSNRAGHYFHSIFFFPPILSLSG
jgi:hypothetical protein